MFFDTNVEIETPPNSDNLLLNPETNSEPRLLAREPEEVCLEEGVNIADDCVRIELYSCVDASECLK